MTVEYQIEGVFRYTKTKPEGDFDGGSSVVLELVLPDGTRLFGASDVRRDDTHLFNIALHQLREAMVAHALKDKS